MVTCAVVYACGGPILTIYNRIVTQRALRLFRDFSFATSEKTSFQTRVPQNWRLFARFSGVSNDIKSRRISTNLCIHTCVKLYTSIFFCKRPFASHSEYLIFTENWCSFIYLKILEKGFFYYWIFIQLLKQSWRAQTVMKRRVRIKYSLVFI